MLLKASWAMRYMASLTSGGGGSSMRASISTDHVGLPGEAVAQAVEQLVETHAGKGAGPQLVEQDAQFGQGRPHQTLQLAQPGQAVLRGALPDGQAAPGR